MILLLICIIALLLFGIFFTTNCKKFKPLLFVYTIGLFFTITGSISLIFYTSMIFDYQAAQYKVELINANCGTSYTKAQLFYAPKIIEELVKECK